MSEQPRGQRAANLPAVYVILSPTGLDDQWTVFRITTDSTEAFQTAGYIEGLVAMMPLMYDESRRLI